MVKRFIQQGVFEGEAVEDFYGNRELPLKKVGGLIVPDDAEIKRNNRARSAKLRIAEKKMNQLLALLNIEFLQKMMP